MPPRPAGARDGGVRPGATPRPGPGEPPLGTGLPSASACKRSTRSPSGTSGSLCASSRRPISSTSRCERAVGSRSITRHRRSKACVSTGISTTLARRMSSSSSSAVASTKASRVRQLRATVRSRRSSSICSDSTVRSCPAAASASKRCITRSGSRASSASTRSATAVRSAWPSTARASCSPTALGSAANASTWSSSVIASRTEPPAARATSRRPAGSTPRPSRSRMFCRCRTISATDTRRKSSRETRERIVGSTLCGSVVANTKFTWAGGSSSVLSRALNADVVNMWTSSMM